MMLWRVQATGNERFPYRISILDDERPVLILHTQDKWPGPKGHIFCIREEGIFEGDHLLEEEERVPIVSFRKMGKRVAVVLDRPNRKRCDFLFLTKQYKNREGSYEQIFFRTQAALKEHRSRTRRELIRDPGIEVVIDSAERYPWSFANARVRKEKLPAGDYALIHNELYAAVVERKTFDNFLRDLNQIAILHQQMNELSAYRHSALVIEAQYGDFLDTKKVQGRWPITHIARALSEISALHSKVQIVYAGNRKMANQWCRGYFTAVKNIIHRKKEEAELPLAAEHTPRYATPKREEMLLRKAILEEIPSRFSIDELRSQFPEAGDQKIRLILNRLKKQGRIRCEGRGKAARWIRLS